MMETDLSAASLFDLKGRTALVTGASRGIAAAIATVLAENGAKVCINYSAEADQRMGFPDAAARLRDTLVARGCDVALHDVDLAALDGPERLIDGLEPGFRHLDIVVLSASLQIHNSFLDLSRQEIESQIGLNFVNTALILQKILPGMMERRYGRILTIGSVQETVSSPEMPIYSATKAAQWNLVQNLAAQFASHGIAINNLSPGLIETDRNLFM
jgi:NAD(P)-dependent dehydrogenase (short-subunit alcohol dehydrogenase family)